MRSQKSEAHPAAHMGTATHSFQQRGESPGQLFTLPWALPQLLRALCWHLGFHRACGPHSHTPHNADNPHRQAPGVHRPGPGGHRALLQPPSVQVGAGACRWRGLSVLPTVNEARPPLIVPLQELRVQTVGAPFPLLGPLTPGACRGVGADAETRTPRQQCLGPVEACARAPAGCVSRRGCGGVGGGGAKWPSCVTPSLAVSMTICRGWVFLFLLFAMQLRRVCVFMFPCAPIASLRPGVGRHPAKVRPGTPRQRVCPRRQCGAG